MNFQIEIVILCYITLCISLLFFNVTFLLYRRIEARKQEKESEKWKEEIRRAFLCGKDQKDFKLHSDYICKNLQHLYQMNAFLSAFEEMTKQEHHKLRSYISLFKQEFLNLAEEIGKKNSLTKAYFAFIVARISTTCPGLGTKMADKLVDYVCDASIYCRENALNALYALGSQEELLLAIRYMNRSGVMHHNKLVVDGLMTFRGDKRKLAGALYSIMEEFEVSYQVAFIDFTRMVSGEFTREYAAMLKAVNIDDEIRFAIIRYFRKYYYEPVREYLKDCLILSGLDWQYGALAALALENYPGEDTIKLLLGAMNNRNWYIRYNATESLVHLHVDYHELQAVYNGDDRYAREMILYKMAEDSIRKGKMGVRGT